MSVSSSPGGNAAFPNFSSDYSHILDPNERRRLALAEIDKVPFGWSHVRAIAVAGIGFFTDSYDIFAINSVTQCLGLVYWQGQDGGIMPLSTQTAIKVAVSIGAVIGQVVFGHLADRLGRRKMYGVELLIMIFCTFVQASVGTSQAINFTAILIAWRVLLGIGIGGDYALSAVITAEFATTRFRGAMMASVFAMQGMGQLAAAVVSLIAATSFNGALSSAARASDCNADCQLAADRMWRIVVGVGAIPACFALYYRLTIPETPRYTFDVSRDVFKAEQDTEYYLAGRHTGFSDPVNVPESGLRIPRGSFRDFFQYFGQWKRGKVLLGTSASWFLVDIAFYGLSLNNSVVLSSIGYGGSGVNIYQQLYDAAIGSLILVCAGSIPGYWMTVGLVDVIGRKTIQMLGFAMLSFFFLVIGFDFHQLSSRALLALYALSQFFFQFGKRPEAARNLGSSRPVRLLAIEGLILNPGPNATTFIYPAECFPTRYRATGHGISAAWGKVGSIVAIAVATPLEHIGSSPNCSSAGSNCTPWLNHMMQIFALVMACGLASTMLLPETKGKSLEELSGEGGFPSIDLGPPALGLRGERAGTSTSSRTGSGRRGGNMITKTWSRGRWPWGPGDKGTERVVGTGTRTVRINISSPRSVLS
ncbi:MAG: hypothetical protein MMC33_009926 [Icmadophila ericetorum]|nr:hypothetical protein [Icmadophila ericetorum]